MRRVASLLAVLLALPASAQLAGTYDIPGDYATLAAAVADLQAQGASAAVTFRFAPGAHAGAPIDPWPSTGTGDELTLTSSTADAADVTLTSRIDFGGTKLTLRDLSFETSTTAFATSTATSLEIESSVFRLAAGADPSGTYGVQRIGGGGTLASVRDSEVSGFQYGITLVYSPGGAVDLFVEDNAITGVERGLTIGSGGDNVVRRNRIEATALGLAYGGLSFNGAEYATNGFFENNLVVADGAGVRLDGSIDFFHNTVVSGTGTALYALFYSYADASESAGVQADLRDNLLVSSSGIPYEAEFRNGRSSTTVLSDYNVLWTGGNVVGRVRRNATTVPMDFETVAEFGASLDAQSGESGNEDHSVSADPLFGPDYTPTSTFIDAVGIDVGIADDLTGQSRAALTPVDPGAIAFVASTAEPLTGTYSVGTPSSDFATLADAVAALMTRGVSADVRMELAAGTYVERVEIGSIPGASAAARVTVTTASGDPADVVLAPPSATGTEDNYALSLEGATHVWLLGLTFQATHPTYQTGILLGDDVTDVRVVGNVFTGGTRSGTPPRIGGFSVRTGVPLRGDGLYLIGNTFDETDSGIQLAGEDGAEPTDVRLVDNELDVLSDGVALQDLDAPLIVRNRIDARTDALELVRVVGATAIRQNRIFTRWDGIDVSGSDGIAGAEIVNNTISIFPSPVRTGYAIRLNNSRGWQILHNSTAVLGDIVDGRGFMLRVNDSPNLAIQNNALGGTGRAVPVWISGSSTPLVSDHNAYSTTVAYGRIDGDLYGTLAGYLAALDAYDPDGTEGTGSIEVADLGYTRARFGDLHTTSPALQSAGIDVGVAVDVDGQPRPLPSGTAPDIGADETEPASARAAQASVEAPAETSLGRPYPNPSSGAVRVPFAVSEAGPVAVEVWDVLGRRVAVLAEGTSEAGAFEAAVPAGQLAPGAYVVRMRAGAFEATAQLTVIR